MNVEYFEEVQKKLQEKMSQSLEKLKKDFSGLRAGRASVGFLEPVVVSAYGQMMPLSQLASVSVVDSQMLLVQVWDKSMMKAVELALRDPHLALNPQVEGQIMRVALPPLTEERRKEIVKLTAKYGENCRVSVRNIRREGMDDLKKMKKDNRCSEDEYRNYGEKIQLLTDNFIKEIDTVQQKKEAEIYKI